MREEDIDIEVRMRYPCRTAGTAKGVDEWVIGF